MRFHAGTLVASLLAGFFSSLAASDSLFLEPFNGRSLAPGWTVSFVENGAGWSYTVGGGALAVTDITPAVVPPSCASQAWAWATVNLDHPIVIGGDFTCDAQVSWDSASSVNAMQ